MSGCAQHGKHAQPIFFEPTGRRWRLILRSTGSLALIVLLLVGTATVGSTRPLVPDPGVPLLTGADIARRPPVVGSGPLVRLTRTVRSGNRVIGLADLYDHERIRPVTAEEHRAIGDAPLVIDLYSGREDGQPTIALTFDDGPDPVYTPLLLDLLSEHEVPATFFVTGGQAARHPELLRRIIREGHLLANHTVTHADVSVISDVRARQEMILTDRIIRAITGISTGIFRPPYGGNDVPSAQGDALAFARAQRLGYVVANYDFDSEDWRHDGPGGLAGMPRPDLDGQDVTILLHDSGGERQNSIDYVEELIGTADEAGYRFGTMAELHPELADRVEAVSPTIFDRATLGAAHIAYVWPGGVLTVLFLLGILTVVGLGLFSALLAVLRRGLRRPAAPLPPHVGVTVLIAAYNEEEVIGATLDCVVASNHRELDILVVDDGSTDGTSAIVRASAQNDPRIRLLTQPNGGKSSALNRGLAVAHHELIVTFDADTHCLPDTVGCLVRRLAADPVGRLAAVAGVIKVGNRRNLLTRWQAVEYITQISIDRAAQDVLRAIMVVPGACSSWRRSAVLAVGGYSDRTLAEDLDLSLSLQRFGYRVTQDDGAICLTEAPETLDAFLKQRTRWVFGTVQALWKHRGMIGNARFGTLGLVMLPLNALSVLVPLVFMPVLYIVAGVAVVAHGSFAVLYAAALFGIVHAVTATIGVILARESVAHLPMIPIYRLIAEPLRVYLLYKATYNALHGTQLRWNKLRRTGSVGAPRRGVLRLPEGGPLVPMAHSSPEIVLDLTDAAMVEGSSVAALHAGHESRRRGRRRTAGASR